MRHIKKYQENIVFFVVLGLIQLLVLLINFNPLNLLYLILVNGLYSLYFLRKINKFVFPTIFIVGFFLSVYLAGLKLSHNIFNDPSNLEAINQLRGGSDSFGKFFYNKLTYIYFYFKSLASYLDLYFWVEKIGLVTFIIFIISCFSLIQKNKLSSLLPLLFLLPIGFLIKPMDALNFLLFVPIISFMITLFLFKQKEIVRFLSLGLIIVGILIHFFWPVKIIL